MNDEMLKALEGYDVKKVGEIFTVSKGRDLVCVIMEDLRVGAIGKNKEVSTVIRKIVVIA